MLNQVISKTVHQFNYVLFIVLKDRIYFHVHGTQLYNNENTKTAPPKNNKY